MELVSLQYQDTQEWQDYVALLNERPELFIQNDYIKIILDIGIIEEYVKRNDIKIGVIYKSKYRILIVDLVSDQSGQLYTYERIIPTINKNSVATLTMFNGSFVLLKQFRHPSREFDYHIPRGFGSVNLYNIDSAAREIERTLNTKVSGIRHLGDIKEDSTLYSKQTSVYMASIESFRVSDKYEGIDSVTLFTPDELEEYIRNGTIKDSVTIVAYTLYKISIGRE